MKLNIACGRDIKEGFINVDSYERENELDLVIDVTKKWPWKESSCEYIYAEQFIEHLEWNDGLHFLRNCCNTLENGGILRLVLPNYRKIFKKYIENDNKFFKVFFDGLNKEDYPYYCSVYTDPDKIKKERKDNPPPRWHTSWQLDDRKRLERRVRFYKYNIEILDWFCHQYGEHKTLYDFENLKGILRDIGFSEVKKTKRKKIDSNAPTRITSSIYIEAIK